VPPVKVLAAFLLLGFAIFSSFALKIQLKIWPFLDDAIIFPSLSLQEVYPRNGMRRFFPFSFSFLVPFRLMLAP